ncbi:MAG: BofC C-terminal domain-containing protein [Clostridia bacterium]|nr:BofC C-terminal domain-containing protein [Clostridia bacterium]
MQKNTYRFLLIAVLCLLLTIGTLWGYRLGKDIGKSPKTKEVAVDNMEPTVPSLPIFSNEDNSINIYEEEKKSEFKIVKNIKYTDCSHEDSSEDVIIATSIDEALKTINGDFEVKSKTDKSAIIEKYVDGYCSNHYLVTTQNEKVVVFRCKSKKEKEIYLTLDTPIIILRDDTLEDLKKGIEVDSIQELNSIIEELES